MADKLKIKLSIADRVYPLTINPQQEEGLRKAAKKIEAMIKQFEQSYAVRDKQDVLAMCALQFAAQTEQKDIERSTDTLQAEDKLKSLNDLLQKHLVS
ncbi:cell division protein ZapA [Salegentibacter sp. JZCK2]|uniref:cell division protein ZapA n=1 Tax=Salegentibacter tibetensis TaxID=2873600 RepID=UPI001CCA793B|nr:cell division protein ZapA [Salegentibacter tibetensis]MBZ9731472.1 cell division protein ZapA [Salegentibacter tibetensis]